MGIFSKLFPSRNERELKRLEKTADQIETLADRYSAMSDEELRACTAAFKERLAAGETLDDLLPEAFAVVREASGRVLGMRHFRVQLIGGIVLHQGRIAEMRTGEGKTLVATLPVYLNALTGKGVHVVTVNEYLAARDAEWMGKIYTFLGLTVGINRSRVSAEEKRKAYECDIMYTTNNELGFDYLRDNMVVRKSDRVQRGLEFAIVDEVDSILIDEARTPLIISGRSSKPNDMYEKAQRFFKTLKGVEYVCPSCGTRVDDDNPVKDKSGNVICPECGSACENTGDYEYIVKDKSVYLNESGALKAEKYFGIENLSDYENQELKHYIDNALRANVVMHSEVNYLVVDGEIIIVDEFTGRQMIGRRYSNGLHQAIEAKEGVKIRSEDKTCATITFQNLFRLYRKLSGMTGTAKTEENEFESTYNLDVIVVPTNKPVIRVDEEDQLYVNEDAKFRAIIADIKKCHERKQPVLVGTVSVEKSEKLSSMLGRMGLRSHNVLNAKYHDREAEIVAQAGKLGAITIATNMAGRGTDIMLGGNPEFMAKAAMVKKGYAHEMIEAATSLASTDDEAVIRAREEYNRLYQSYKQETDKEKEEVTKLGGLRIIGTERHESRRIDNQLRGRSGRQGDPGSSVFYLSMDDDILRRFGGEAMQSIVTRLVGDPDIPISAKIISRQIESAQARVEDRNFSTRKHLLAYDDVLTRQREIIYKQRNEVLDNLPIHEQILQMIYDIAEEICAKYVDFKTDHREWDYENFNRELEEIILENGTGLLTPEFVYDHRSLQEIINDVYNVAKEQYENEIALSEADALEKTGRKLDYDEIERTLMLKVVDEKWIEHIDRMDELKQSVGLVAYAQQDPVLVYKREGYEMFDEMIYNIHHTLVKMLCKGRIRVQIERRSAVQNGKTSDQSEENATAKRSGAKVGRNDPCPCGSGKKYKNCCGK